MDRFEKVITKEKLSLLKRNPLPNHPAYYDFEMSFDNIDIFINLYANKLNSHKSLNVNLSDIDFDIDIIDWNEQMGN